MELILAVSVLIAFGSGYTLLTSAGYGIDDRILRRLSRYTAAAPEDRPRERITTPFRERIIKPIFEKLLALITAKVSETVRNRIRMKLLNAGYPLQTTPEEFLIKNGACIVGLVLAAGVVQQGWGVSPAITMVTSLAGIGLLALLTYIALAGRIRTRKAKIERELPELLDIAQIGVEAGLSIDSCLERIVREPSRNAMIHEFRIYLQDVKMGLPRMEALQQLYLRTQCKSVKLFTEGIVQSLKTGSTLGNILQMIRRDIYEEIRSCAEKRANRTPVVMMIPLILFIFPIVFLILLGPTLLILLNELKKMEVVGF